MTAEPIRCFVSYCHEDVDVDVLHYLEFLLDEYSAETYTLLTDERLPYGRSIPQFMDAISTVHAVIIVMTPAYARKVLERAGGVYAEYKLIVARYQGIQDALKSGLPPSKIKGLFELIPILLSGKEEDSVPPQMMDLHWVDLRRLTVTRHPRTQQFVETSFVKQTFTQDIRKIADQLIALTALSSPKFEERYEELYDRLFINTKADWTNWDRDDIQALFVETFAFREIRDQRKFMTVGRKGSGKSTIAEVIAQIAPQRFKGTVAIVADHINLNLAYSQFDTDRLQSDTRHILRRPDCFAMAWEAFLILFCMHILLDVQERNELSEEQANFMPPIRELVNDVWKGVRSSQLSDINNIYFTFAFHQIVNYIEDCISTARSDRKHFYSDIQAKFTLEGFLNYVFSTGVLANFEGLLATCERKFLVTLDGFDTAFDLFRREGIGNYPADEIRRRAYFEVDWLSSLLRLVIEIRSRRTRGHLHRLLEFCVAVPKDRFVDVMNATRDAYRFQNQYAHLNWSGIELAILLRKRLERMTGYKSDERRKPEGRLADVFRTEFPHLPHELNFKYNGANYRMPLFMYVLRHTFWRPRDILVYYAKLIAAADDLKRRGRRMTTEIARRAIKETTYQIISDEFINEFSASLINIKQVVDAFAGEGQLISYERLAGILESVEFQFAFPRLGLRLVDKILFLHEIGFLGMIAQHDERFARSNKYLFSFNEGLSIEAGVPQEHFSRATFVVHPIFSEYLRLNTSGTELVLEFNWEYLHAMEALFSSPQPMR